MQKKTQTKFSFSGKKKTKQNIDKTLAKITLY